CMMLEMPRRPSIVFAAIAWGRHTALNGRFLAASATAHPTVQTTRFCSTFSIAFGAVTRGSVGETKLPSRRESTGKGTRRSSSRAIRRPAAASITRLFSVQSRTRKLCRRRNKGDRTMVFQFFQEFLHFAHARLPRDLEFLLQRGAKLVDVAWFLNQLPDAAAHRVQADIVARIGAHHHEVVADPC